jgi:hypothetical protein
MWFFTSPSRRISKDKGFDPDAIKLTVMKLTSDSIGKLSRSHGSAIKRFSLNETATPERRPIALDITPAAKPNRSVMSDDLFNGSPRASA